MIRFLIVMETLKGGGAERVASLLAREWCKNGNFEVFFSTFERNTTEYQLDKSIHRVSMSKTSKNDMKKLFYLKKIIKKIKPDIIVSLGMPRTSVLLSMCTFLHRQQLILSERNDPIHFPNNKILRILRTLSYMLSDGVVFQTYDAQKFFNRYIQKKSIVIPNPISDDLPKPYNGIRTKRIVNFCRFEPQKNLHMLIDAFGYIANEFPDYVLELYGRGALKSDLEKYIIQKKLTEQVILKDFSSDIHSDILNSALFVSSSDYEGISNSMLEAMAIGIPTICTDCPIGGARMIIDNYKNGILVPVQDSKALSKAIRQVLLDKDLSKTLCQNGAKIRNEYSKEKISNMWLAYIMR